MKKESKKELDKRNIQEPNSSKTKPIKSNPNFVNWLVFLFSITIVLISLISIVFPALIASNNPTFDEFRELGIVPGDIDPFEVGVWAGPLIVTDLVIFFITILYFKKKLPKPISKGIDFVFSFEVSKKVAFIAIVLLLATYIGFSASELTLEEAWEDYPGVKKRVENWSPDQIIQGFEPHVRYFLIWSSMNLFGYFTIIPFIASISLLVLVYFFTVEITKKRFSGIISVIILLQSHVFLTYDTTVAYTNFWILFYLLSLYLIYKLWFFSSALYILSIFSKALTVMFLPLSLFFIYRSSISSSKKKILIASTAAIIFGGVLVIASGFTLEGGSGEQEEYDSVEFWLGFTSFSYQLRFDGLVIVFILPLIVGLFIASRNGILHADTVMILLVGILFSAPLLTGFTNQTAQPYRFVPLVVFFAMGVGILLSKRKISSF